MQLPQQSKNWNDIFFQHCCQFDISAQLGIGAVLQDFFIPSPYAEVRTDALSTSVLAYKEEMNCALSLEIEQHAKLWQLNLWNGGVLLIHNGTTVDVKERQFCVVEYCIGNELNFQTVKWSVKWCLDDCALIAIRSTNFERALHTYKETRED